MRIHEKTKTQNAGKVILRSNLIEVVDAVNASIRPGEEDLVPYIVSHLLNSLNATPGNA